MNIGVIGATGKTGATFVEQALSRGHVVTALVRSPEKLSIKHPCLQVIKGDVLNANNVAQAIHGQDAIFIALGTGKIPKKSSIRADGTCQIVNALRAMSEKPLVVILSSLGVGESQQQMPRYWRWILNPILGNAFADHHEQENIVRTSQLPYVILRPTFMSDAPTIARTIATAAPNAVNVVPSLPRANVTAFALQAIERQITAQRAVALTAR